MNLMIISSINKIQSERQVIDLSIQQYGNLYAISYLTQDQIKSALARAEDKCLQYLFIHICVKATQVPVPLH